MKRMLPITAALLAAVFILAPIAQADTLTFREQTETSPGSGVYAWSEPTNWQDTSEPPQTGVPTTDDRAVIPAGTTCTILATGSDVVADTVSVSGTLDIQAGRTLTLDNDYDNLGGGAGTDNSAVAGTIKLKESGSTLAFAEQNHTLSGAGAVVGEHNSAKMTIASSKTLTSTTTIQGRLQIAPASGASSTGFVNDTGGLVLADAAGTLDMQADTVSGAGDWQVSSNGSAVLKFTTGSQSLTGDLSVSTGRLDIADSITTTGTLDFSGGEIDVASGKTFTAGQ
jgi:hypothetical protein